MLPRFLFRAYTIFSILSSIGVIGSYALVMHLVTHTTRCTATGLVMAMDARRLQAVHATTRTIAIVVSAYVALVVLPNAAFIAFAVSPFIER